jgi:hypothetical protein
MPKLSAIKKISTELQSTIPALGDLKITFRYFPGQFTPEFEEQLLTMFEQADSPLETLIEKEVEAVEADTSLTVYQKEQKKKDIAKVKNYTVSLLAGLVDVWDITDDDEIPLAVTEVNVATIPYVILKQLFKDITADMTPKETSSGI